MKVNLASSQCVKVRVIEYEDTDVIALVQAGKVGELTTAINADRRQKVALVEFRQDLSEKIEALGFKRKVESITKDGQTVEVPAETEGDHIGRFTDALADGSLTLDGFTLPSGDDKVKNNAAIAYLQKLAFTCGDKTDAEGNPCYQLDVTRPVRVAKSNLIPKWAMDAAATIIKNGSQAKWKANFTNGYTSVAGIAVDPVPFEDFEQVAAAEATPEQAEAIAQSNQKRLAAAVQAARKNEDSKRQSDFA